MDKKEWEVNDNMVEAEKMDTPGMRKNGKWAKEEDDILRKSYAVLSENNYTSHRIWKDIETVFEGTRTRKQCEERLKNLLSFRPKYTRWNDEEDFELLEHVKKNGERKWNQADCTFVRIRGASRKRWNVLKRKAEVDSCASILEIITRVESFLHS